LGDAATPEMLAQSTLASEPLQTAPRISDEHAVQSKSSFPFDLRTHDVVHEIPIVSCQFTTRRFVLVDDLFHKAGAARLVNVPFALELGQTWAIAELAAPA